MALESTPTSPGSGALQLAAETPTHGTPVSVFAASTTDVGGDSRSWSDRLLGDGPRWLLVAVLVYAPWAYGCTRPWTLPILNGVLYTVLGGWLLGCALRRQPPRIHRLLLGCVAWLGLQGWWMTLNSGWIYDDRFQAHARTAWLPAWPGSVNYAASLPAMTGVAALLGVICLVADLARRPVWRRRLLLTMAMVGISIAALGVAQKLTGAPGIFWQAEGHAPTFFGPYRYHANAGAFLNLIWPLVLLFLGRSLRDRRARRQSVAWAAGLAIVAAAILTNTSRASGFIAVCLLAAWGGFHALRRLRGRSEDANPTAVAGVTLALIALILGVIALGGLDATLRRWQYFDQEFSWRNPRLLAARVCVEMLPASGWLGFGPGAFKTAFPFFNRDTTAATNGVWLQAHQDYLQTLVEWGWLGAAAWAGLAFGALARLAGRHDSRRSPKSASDRSVRLALAAGLLAVLLHALADFPLQIASIQLYLAVVVGLAWRLPGTSEEPGGETPRHDVPEHDRSVLPGAGPWATPPTSDRRRGHRLRSDDSIPLS